MTSLNRTSGLGRYLRLFFSLSDLALFNLMFGLTLLLTHAAPADDLKMLWVTVSVSYLAARATVRAMRRKTLLGNVTGFSLPVFYGFTILDLRRFRKRS